MKLSSSATDIGANASAEEATEDLEAGSRQVIDVVDAFGLFNTGPMVKEVDVTEKGKTKKEYTYFLDVLKRTFASVPWLSKKALVDCWQWVAYVGRVTKVRIEKKAKYMKEILKVSDEEIEKVVATMEEENKAFKAAVAVYWKKQLRPNLKDFEWYRGSDDPEMQGM